MSSFVMHRVATLGAPLAAIAYGCIRQGLVFSSMAPVIIVTVFALLQAGLRHYLLEAVYDYFAAVGKVRQYWTVVGILHALLGLGCVQLYLLVTH